MAMGRKQESYTRCCSCSRQMFYVRIYTSKGEQSMKTVKVISISISCIMLLWGVVGVARGFEPTWFTWFTGWGLLLMEELKFLFED
jgi:hypothetical protein